MRLTIAANEISTADGHVNAYEVRNALLIEKRKARVRYKNGVTEPASAQKLRVDAERMARHARILARNIKNATGQAKHMDWDAHHIVALTAKEARLSREQLFGWGIGINDVDNGIYLPRKRYTALPGFPNASPHENVHTSRYYLEVTDRLLAVADERAPRARLELRGMKSDLVAGTFPY